MSPDPLGSPISPAPSLRAIATATKMLPTMPRHYRACTKRSEPAVGYLLATGQRWAWEPLRLEPTG